MGSSGSRHQRGPHEQHGRHSVRPRHNTSSPRNNPAAVRVVKVGGVGETSTAQPTTESAPKSDKSEKSDDNSQRSESDSDAGESESIIDVPDLEEQVDGGAGADAVTDSAKPNAPNGIESETDVKISEECRYCFDAKSTIAYIPCGHMGLCADCYDKVKERKTCIFCNGDTIDALLVRVM